MTRDMVVAKEISAVRTAVAAARRQGQRVGLVPTMGALHEGHLSLIRRARAHSDYVVVSIFVNPAQFGPQEDFSRYPRPLEQDLMLCQREGVQLAFTPAQDAIYPPGHQTIVEVQQLQKGMEGVSRPGHFRGVATVVLKLFNIVQPDVAFFGQKDAQQVRVIQQMVRDLDVPVEVLVVDTVREPDGLALSSRNRYLSPTDRRHAVVLHQVLEEARRQVLAGEDRADPVKSAATDRIGATPGAALDYIAIVDWETLDPVEELTGRILIALAVRFGSTRLIDNVLFNVPIKLA